MKTIERIKIPQEVSLYIERLEYEYSGWRNLVLAAERLKTDDESYTRIARDAQTAYMELEAAKEEFRKEYIPEPYQRPCFKYYFDFGACEAVICRGEVA